MPVLPFADNPDPTLCGIPEPDGRHAIVTGEYICSDHQRCAGSVWLAS